jgi:hypothetical protein
MTPAPMTAGGRAPPDALTLVLVVVFRPRGSNRWLPEDGRGAADTGAAGPRR